ARASTQGAGGRGAGRRRTAHRLRGWRRRRGGARARAARPGPGALGRGRPARHRRRGARRAALGRVGHPRGDLRLRQLRRARRRHAVRPGRRWAVRADRAGAVGRPGGRRADPAVGAPRHVDLPHAVDDQRPRALLHHPGRGGPQRRRPGLQLLQRHRRRRHRPDRRGGPAQHPPGRVDLLRRRGLGVGLLLPGHPAPADHRHRPAHRHRRAVRRRAPELGAQRRPRRLLGRRELRRRPQRGRRGGPGDRLEGHRVRLVAGDPQRRRRRPRRPAPGLPAAHRRRDDHGDRYAAGRRGVRCGVQHRGPRARPDGRPRHRPPGRGELRRL
ncbi:MAG: ABC transporter, substrate-binding protein (cluster 12, methionine/phosphonates), partial [uncultured Pseudonocardia sp.]